jgi:tRNA/tmRNA/rRNA uracil-C5-methylase (TrmA/RlmC/RlmD family)
VSKVIGVELIEEAVLNARENVKLNASKFEGK